MAADFYAGFGPSARRSARSSAQTRLCIGCPPDGVTPWSFRPPFERASRCGACCLWQVDQTLTTAVTRKSAGELLVLRRSRAGEAYDLAPAILLVVHKQRDNPVIVDSGLLHNRKYVVVNRPASFVLHDDTFLGESFSASTIRIVFPTTSISANVYSKCRACLMSRENNPFYLAGNMARPLAVDDGDIGCFPPTTFVTC